MVAVGLSASLLGPLDYMFGETLRVTIVVALFLAVAVAVCARFNEWSFERSAKNWLWATSLVTIFLFTQHSPYRGHGHQLDLTPLGDLKAARYSSHRRDLVLANIALFAPFGAAAAWRRVSFPMAFAWGLGLSVSAETMQFILGQGRIAQIDDVIFNTSGAALGWLAASLVLWTLVARKRSSRGERGRAPVRAGRRPG